MLAAAALLSPGDAAARGRRRAVPDLDGSAEHGGVRRRGADVRIPVTVHLATYEGWDLASQARVEQWVARANRALQPHGIEVYVDGVRRLPTGFADVRRSKQRRDMASYAPHDGAVHLFVIESLDLVPQRLVRRRVRGLHWRYRGLNRELRSREYVVVTREAPDTTLAHEIGHLLGLRHSTEGDNIMCSCRSGDVMLFTGEQGQAMRSGAEQWQERHRTAALGSRARADRRRR